jgi:invasion protein IalB
MTFAALMRLSAATTLLAVASGAAWSQAPAPPPAQAPSQAPQRTTASYEDWTVRCETRGTPPQKSCEMVQAVTAQGQSNPVTQIAIGRASAKEPVKVVFQLPINVWIPTGVKLVYDAKAAPLAAAFRSCVPAGCFAHLDLNNDMLKRLRAVTIQGRFEFKDAGQRNVAIPVSFKGFGQAFDALSKE